MPTGYTHDVQTGKLTSFRAFALRCARAFGACIMQRDDDPNDLPKPREKSDFYEVRLKESTARLRELLAMTEKQAATLAEAEAVAYQKRRDDYVAESAATRARYEAMTAQVTAWEAPTAAHVELRKFMLSQLAESIAFDCVDVDRLYPHLDPVDPAKWLAKQIATERANVERYAIEAAKEEQRVAESNGWIDALVKSLPEDSQR